MTFQEYLAQLVRTSEGDLWAAQTARALAKWWLDLMRNMIVVAALQYIAEKSGHWVVSVVAIISYGALFAYVSSYFNTFSLHPFPFIRQRWLEVALSLLVMIPLVLLPYFAVSVGFRMAVDEVSKIQTR